MHMPRVPQDGWVCQGHDKRTGHEYSAEYHVCCIVLHSICLDMFESCENSNSNGVSSDCQHSKQLLTAVGPQGWTHVLGKSLCHSIAQSKHAEHGLLPDYQRLLFKRTVTVPPTVSCHWQLQLNCRPLISHHPRCVHCELDYTKGVIMLNLQAWKCVIMLHLASYLTVYLGALHCS
jgi:hypothetical protein